MKKIISLFLLLTSSYLFSESEQEVDITFNAFSWGIDVNNLYFPNAEGKDVELKLYRDKLTDRHRYVGNNIMPIYRIKQHNEEVIRETVVEVDFTNASWKQIVILFKNPNKREKSPFKVMTYTNRPEDFPKGSIRLYNFTSKNVAMKLGKELNGVKSMGTMVFTQDTNNNRNIELSKLFEGANKNGSDSMHIAIESKSGWKPAFKSAWPKRPDAKTHFFLFPIGEKHYRVRSLFEYGFGED